MATVAAYLDVLLRELDMVAQKLPEGVTLSRLHWGGGTPTLLSPDMIRKLASKIDAVLPFAENAEFSVEIDPNEIDGPRLDALVAAGLTRASVGVQDFDPDIQNTIGRIQDFATTKHAVDGLRERGIESLNIDLLYGLPHQTKASITDSIQKVLSLGPDRVALYGYAHVPWMARRQSLIPSDSLPRPEERFELFKTAQKLFHWDGFQSIGIDHFSRPGDGLVQAEKAGVLRRNFQGYTDDQSDILLGLGASSISRFPEGFAQNASATSAWQKLIDSDQLATVRGHILTPEDRLRAVCIEELMCNFSVDFRRVAARTGASPQKVSDLFEGVEKRFPEVIRATDTGITLSKSAHPLARIIARTLDAHEVNAKGHSLAI